MSNPHIELYMKGAQGGLDPQELAEALAVDVRWFEAGIPEPFVGREAVLARFAALAEIEPVSVDTVLADDGHLVAVGRARIGSGPDALEYRYAEYFSADADGKIAERRSFMDAVPADVAQRLNGGQGHD